MKKYVALIPLVTALAGCGLAPTEPALDFENISLGAVTSEVEPAPSEPVEEEPGSGNNAVSEVDYARDRNAEIEIEDQAGDGYTVVIDEIHVAAGNAFLVIYDSTGLVRSSTLVTPQSQPVVVRFEAPLASSQELEAALYLDNGDGKLSLTDDFPILGDEDELVHEDFNYTVLSSD